MIYQVISQASEKYKNILVITQKIIEDPRVTVSHDPLAKLSGYDFIIYDHFKFNTQMYAQVRFDLLKTIKDLKQVTIKFDDDGSLLAAHDKLVMCKQDHSIYFGTSEVNLARNHPGFYGVDISNLYICNLKTIRELFLYHEITGLYFTTHLGDAIPSINSMKRILHAFTLQPNRALTVTAFSYASLLHPNTIEIALNFLRLAGCVKPVALGHQTVVIQKILPCDDIEYHMLPEGKTTVNELLKLLKIEREDLFELLKKYEDKNIRFSYYANGTPRAYVFVKDINEVVYGEVAQLMAMEHELLKALLTIPNFINTLLDSTIDKHCLRKGMQAIKITENDTVIEIDPKGLSFPASIF